MVLSRGIYFTAGGAPGSLDSSTLKLVAIWKLVAAMVAAAAPLLNVSRYSFTRGIYFTTGGAPGSLDSSTLKLVAIWKLVAAMAAAAAPLLRPGGGDGAVPVGEGAYRAGGVPLRAALLRGALRSLGDQAKTEVSLSLISLY